MQSRSVLFSLVLALSMVGVACGGDEPENLGGQGGEVGGGGSGGTDVGEGGSGGTDVGEGGTGGSDVGEGGTGGTDVGEGGTGGTDVGEGGTGGTDVGEGGTGGTDVGEGGAGGSEVPVVEVGSVEIVYPGSCSIRGSSCTTPDVGGVFQLEVTVLDLDGEPLPDVKIEWASGDTDIATVVDGFVIAVGPGTTTVTATAGGVSDTVEVTAAWNKVAFIDITEENNGSLEINVGETLTLVASGSVPGRFGPVSATLGFPIWEVADPTVVEIVEEKIVNRLPALVLRGLQAGTVAVNIRAHEEQVPYPDLTEVTASANVTVVDR